ncbi:MAG: hypothetical protein ACO1N9_12555 [Flavobacterium sp.]
MKIFLAFLLFPVLLFAQTDFDKIPLKGKIASYTISRISGDSLRPKSDIIEKVTYDKKGRLLRLYKKDARSYATEDQELNVYEGNTVTNFRCECKDVEAFAKTFVIRDNAELKTMPRYATDSPPSKFVKITQLDKKGDPVLVSHYSASGYKVGETKSWFDKSGNAIKVERYDVDGKLTQTEINTYNNSGKGIEKIVQRDREQPQRDVWSYSADGKYNATYAYYTGDVLKVNVEYTITDKGAYKEHGTIDKLRNAASADKHVYHDTAGREIKVIRLNPDGTQQSRFESTYDANGNLTSYAIYYKDDVLSTKYEYTYDGKGNWITMNIYQLVNVHGKDKIEARMDVSKYKREIVYLK